MAKRARSKRADSNDIEQRLREELGLGPREQLELPLDEVADIERETRSLLTAVRDAERAESQAFDVANKLRLKTGRILIRAAEAWQRGARWNAYLERHGLSAERAWTLMRYAGVIEEREIDR